MTKPLINRIIGLFITLMVLGSAVPGFAQPNASQDLANETPTDQAFNLQAQFLKDGQLELRWDIAPQHFIYRDQIKIINSENQSLLQDYHLPKGETINDPTLGAYVVYSKELIITLPKSANLTNNIIVHYQGCAKGGFCYLPENKLLTIDADRNVTISDSNMAAFEHKSETDKLALTIQQRFLPLTLLIFFGLGVLLSFSPCVLPMIPLVVNLIIGPKPISSHKALILAGSYVLGMAGSYASAGIGAGMLGSTLQGWLQQPLILIGMSVFVVILALAQFDLIHIKLPHFNKKLHHWGQKQLQGSVLGAFILGIISALIVSPCITAPLIGVLTYISQHGNPLVGGLTLLCLGLGMGVPLIIVAMLSSIILPAAGAWMNLIKTITGVALLGLAIWILQRVIPAEFTMMLWGALCIVTAVFFKAFEPLHTRKRSGQILKALGILLAIYGAVLIAGAANKKFAFIKTPVLNNAALKGPNWINVTNQDELKKYLSIAYDKQQYTLLEVYADWCVNCKKIEKVVFHDPKVLAKLGNFNLLRLDLTNTTAQQQELMQSLNLYGPPAILFYGPNGEEIKEDRVVGEVDDQQMLKIIQNLH